MKHTLKNRNNPHLIAVFALALCVFLPSTNTLAGGVYKWVDENGTVHYSDIKPNNVDAQSMRVQGGKSGQQRSSAQSKAEDLDQSKQQELEKQAAKLQEETRKRETEAQCETVRANLQKIEENSRIKVNENGELRYLSPEEVQEKKSSFQEILEKRCS